MPNYVLLSLYSPICTVCGSALQHSPTIRPADARVVLLQCYTLVLYTIHTKPTTLFDGNDPLLLYLLMNKVPPFYYLKKMKKKIEKIEKNRDHIANADDPPMYDQIHPDFKLFSLIQFLAIVRPL